MRLFRVTLKVVHEESEREFDMYVAIGDAVPMPEAMLQVHTVVSTTYRYNTSIVNLEVMGPVTVVGTP